jgi:hypothetical protein
MLTAADPLAVAGDRDAGSSIGTPLLTAPDDDSDRI